jgi:type 1 glutamine amidotransferase
LIDPEDNVRVNAALAYGGPHRELEIVIAPPAWTGRWGLGRALKVGERFQAVGYINRTDDGLFRWSCSGTATMLFRSIRSSATRFPCAPLLQ